jgi:putative radical SAM enzyme (TIGR03279 family)
MSKGLKVSAVAQGSIGAELGVEPGDIVLQVDEHEIEDVLDLRYFTSVGSFALYVQKPTGDIWELEIEREIGEELGLELASVGRNGLKRCRNRCVFCFVDQMPWGLRRSLYVKDDDYRLSVTQGSYITLSNLTEAEMRRIIDGRIGPLYISVHAWDPEVRQFMMGHPRASRLRRQIAALDRADIPLHTQIVLVPGLNDGAVLSATVRALAGFRAVRSIGVAPVGLTGHRAGLTALRSVRPDEALAVLEAGRKWQSEFLSRRGKRLVYFADEFYRLAGAAIPSPEEYDDFPQLENGIGLIAHWQENLRNLWPEIRRRAALWGAQAAKREHLHLVTGTAAAPIMAAAAAALMREVPSVRLRVRPVVNRFWGETVNAAGLLTAGDIAAELGDLGGDMFLLPDVMVRREGLFLDGYDIPWLESRVRGRAKVLPALMTAEAW